MSHATKVVLLVIAFVLFVVGCIVDIWPTSKLPGSGAFMAAGLALVDLVILKTI